MLPDGLAMEVVMRDKLAWKSVQRKCWRRRKNPAAEFMSNLARSTRRDAHEMMPRSSTISTASGKPLHHRAGGTQPRGGGTHQIADVHLRRSTAPVLRRCAAVLRVVDRDKLPLALKGASEKLRELFFGAMSERAADAA